MKGNFGDICVCFFALTKDREDASRLMAAVGPASFGLWLKRGGHQRGLSCGVSRFQGAASDSIRRHFCGQVAKGQALGPPARLKSTTNDHLPLPFILLSEPKMSFRKTSCRGAMRGPVAVIADTYRWYYIAIAFKMKDSVGRSPRPWALQTRPVDNGASAIRILSRRSWQYKIRRD